MIHYQYHNTQILFVGINPHHGSYLRGVPFSNNKTFWYLLNKAGLIKEKYADLKDDIKLRQFYENKFGSSYKLGIVNIINRPTRDTSELKRGEEWAGRKRIKKIIKSKNPRVVCFVGKITYEKFIGRKKFDYGWQENIFSSKVYVMHFPLRGSAEIRIRELKEIGKKAGLLR